MPGLVPGIHALPNARKDVDGRDKPGHDGFLEVTVHHQTRDCSDQILFGDDFTKP
jgi:hypothetical protein